MLHTKFHENWPAGSGEENLPLFRPQAAIVFKKSIVFTFSYVKAYVSKFDLAVK